jgi:hypothetical protein
MGRNRRRDRAHPRNSEAKPGTVSIFALLYLLYVAKSRLYLFIVPKQK